MALLKKMFDLLFPVGLCLLTLYGIYTCAIVETEMEDRIYFLEKQIGENEFNWMYTLSD